MIRMAGSVIRVNSKQTTKDHSKLYNRLAFNQHRLESIYREQDNKNLAQIIDELENSKLIMIDKTYAAPQNETITDTIDFVERGIIKGIKVTGAQGDFTVSLYTTQGGNWIYYSGTVTNILWDIMDIPHVDESGNNTIFLEINNLGLESTLRVQIYVMK